MERQLQELETQLANLRTKHKEKQEKEAKWLKKLNEDQKNYVTLNVGGVKYTTSRFTLSKYPESMLESLVSGRFSVECSEDGSYFIDRDGTYFGIILNALRNDSLDTPPNFVDFDALVKEIDFYQLPFKLFRTSENRADFTRQSLMELLVRGQCRFDGMRFCALDLSGILLGLYNCTWTYCDFTGADLSKTQFTNVSLEGCNFSNCILKEAIWTKCNLQKCKMIGAIIIGSNLEECNMCNSVLDNCTLDKSRLPRVNLQNSSLVGASMKETDLTGANLSNANLTKADYSSANLTNTSGVVKTS